MSLIRTGCTVAGFALVFVALGGTASAHAPEVPELSPGSMASALTLLTAGVFLLSARRRKS